MTSINLVIMYRYSQVLCVLDVVPMYSPALSLWRTLTLLIADDFSIFNARTIHAESKVARFTAWRSCTLRQNGVRFVTVLSHQRSISRKSLLTLSQACKYVPRLRLDADAHFITLTYHTHS